MKIMLQIRRWWREEPDDDESAWEELGVYPDRCRAEIMQHAHAQTLDRNGGHYRFVEVPE